MMEVSFQGEFVLNIAEIFAEILYVYRERTALNIVLLLNMLLYLIEVGSLSLLMERIWMQQSNHNYPLKLAT